MSYCRKCVLPGKSSKFIMVMFLSCLLAFAAGSVSAQERMIPDIYSNTPVERWGHEIIAEWPRNTFLESILLFNDGTMLVTEHKEGQLFSVAGGRVRLVSTVLGMELLCVTRDPENEERIYATAWKPGPDGHIGVLLKINPKTGHYTTVTEIPEEKFLNGVTVMPDKRIAMAGSASGSIWMYNPNDDSVVQWFSGDEARGALGIPGINGVQVHAGYIYFSNTGGMKIGRVELLEDGSAGKVEILHNGVMLDDFAVDKNGTIFGATHMEEVLQISSDGTIKVIAQYDQGVVGATSVAITESGTLYIATNGGINHALFGRGPSYVTPAKVVKLMPNTGTQN